MTLIQTICFIIYLSESIISKRPNIPTFSTTTSKFVNKTSLHTSPLLVTDRKRRDNITNTKMIQISNNTNDLLKFSPCALSSPRLDKFAHYKSPLLLLLVVVVLFVGLNWYMNNADTSKNIGLNSLRPSYAYICICVSKLTTIGSDNGLSPEGRQAKIWTNAAMLLTGTLGTIFSEI